MFDPRKDKPSSEDMKKLILQFDGRISQIASHLNIPPSTVRHWANQLTKKNGENRILIIGDTHIPFVHPQYLGFCQKIYNKHKCNMVVHIGDEVDNHSINYHEHDPDGQSPGDELELARKELHVWLEVFPNMIICNGNHTVLPKRKMLTAGLSSQLLKTPNEIWQVPTTWEWVEEIIIDNVLYKHIPSRGGDWGWFTGAVNDMISTVSGHYHSIAAIRYKTTSHSRIFAMSVGCGIHIKAYAMKYALKTGNRPILSCGVVINGILPILEAMEL